MLARKTRRILFVLPIILIIVLLIIAVLIYLNTDMFKSDATLFSKYIGQNIDNIENVYNQIGKNEYNNLLKQNKYTKYSQVEVNYVGNIGTTLENRDNSINKLKLEINGQTDNTNQYKYQDIKLLDSEERIAEIEYIQRENIHGIKFSDLFNQYILVNNENLKELFSKIGYTEEELVNIPDKIEINNELENIIQFSEEEKEIIKTKYLSIINSNVSKENFSKQTNQVVEINEKSVSTNAYVLTLTKEQLNNIYIKLLEEIKQDEIILSKIDEMQEEINEYNNEGLNIREQFIEEVENIITEITKNNIGQEETKIIVYENNKTTIRTMIQTPDYEIIFDVLSIEDKEYLQVTYKNKMSDDEKIMTYNKDNYQISAIYQDKENGNISEYSMVVNDKIDGNDCDRNIIFKHEDFLNSVEINIEQKLNIVNTFDNELIFDGENSINLSLLEEEQLKTILDKVASGVSVQINTLETNIKEDNLELLKSIGIISEEQFLEEVGVTETEKNRFNSKFEILQGDNLDGEAVLKVIEVIKPNLTGMNVVSNTELKLQLDKLNNNEEIATTISTFIEKNKNKKYNVEVEYDEDTKLVNNIILIIVEK